MTSKLLQKILFDCQLNKNLEISCVYFNKKMQKLIVLNDKINAFEHTNEVFLNHDRSTHVSSVLCIAYNKLFDVLITADSNSVIKVWELTTGNTNCIIISPAYNNNKVKRCVFKGTI